jgi:isoquinoline 1-oxidoreductase subunit beta
MSTLVSRRDFVGGMLAVGGSLVVAADLTGCATAATRTEIQFRPSVWLRVGSDGAVLVSISQAEMGQGITTGLSQVVADELGADWGRVQFALADGAIEFINPVLYKAEQITGGSRSMGAFWLPMRTAAAAAREILLQAAGEMWNVAPAACQAVNGTVRHAASGHAIPFGELVERARALPVPQRPRLKSRGEFTLIGQSLPRLDASDKAAGKAIYGIDVRRPGMLYAAVRHAPVHGAEVESFDASLSASMAGVRAVLKLPGALAVVAEHYWQARKALEATTVTFTATEFDGVSSRVVYQQQTRALRSESAAPAPGASGDVAKALAGAAKVVEATYQLPFLAHACMEPISATAEVLPDGSAELWLSSQAPTSDAKFAAEALGIASDRVKVHHTLIGGGFGRRTGREHVSEAVLCAKAVGRSVQVIWSREEDIRTDHLRPAQAAKLTAGLDTENRCISLAIRGASHNYFASARPHLVQNGLDIMGVVGLFDEPYRIPNKFTDYVATPNHLRIGAWRGTSNSHNTFFLEAFIDEVAAAAGKDAFEFRRSMLQHDARSLAVLDKARELSDWGQLLSDRWRGMAYLQAGRWSTRVAEVVELSRRLDGALTIEKITVVVDSGLVVNPALARQNLVGGVIFGLGAALFGDIEIEKGAVVQSNFHDYRLLRLTEVPRIDVHLIESDDKPGSFGEVSLPPLAPALVNAVFAATGKRVRSLPIIKAGVNFA